MEREPLLRPMPKDALIRRAPAPSAAPSARSPVLCEAQKDPACLRKPEFAPFPARRAAPAEEALDELLGEYLMEEDDDDPVGDAVPTHLMPMPVCVPLYEQPAPRRRRSRR